MTKHVISFSEFTKRHRDYLCGLMSIQIFVGEFVLQRVGLDSVHRAIELFDDNLKAHLAGLLKPSPSTEEQWNELRLQHRVKAAKRIRQHDYPMDGFGDNWVFDFDARWEDLSRYQVFAFRSALNLPVHEAEWKDWVNENSELIRASKLPSWIFQTRTHWYAFLNGSLTPYTMFNESLPYDECKSLSNTVRKRSFAELIAQLQLVEHAHPSYFFNFRRRILNQLEGHLGLSAVSLIRNGENAE